MKDQHTKIKGYRDLSQVEIDLMNEIKAKGQELAALNAKVTAYLATAAESKKADAERSKLAPEDEASDECVEYRRFAAAEPLRWAAIARTHFQEGLMALTRSVAQPTTF